MYSQSIIFVVRPGVPPLHPSLRVPPSSSSQCRDHGLESFLILEVRWRRSGCQRATNANYSSRCCYFIYQPPGNPDGLKARGDPSQEGGWVPGNPDGFKARRIPAKRGPKRVRYSFVLAASILAFFDFFFSLRALFFAAFFLANSSRWWGSMRV